MSDRLEKEAKKSHELCRHHFRKQFSRSNKMKMSENYFLFSNFIAAEKNNEHLLDSSGFSITLFRIVISSDG